jgi:hypothetical protein
VDIYNFDSPACVVPRNFMRKEAVMTNRITISLRKADVCGYSGQLSVHLELTENFMAIIYDNDRPKIIIIHRGCRENLKAKAIAILKKFVEALLIALVVEILLGWIHILLIR